MSNSVKSVPESMFSIEVPIKTQDISDLVVTAVEQGIGYWAGDIKIFDKGGKQVRGVLPENLMGECRIVVSEYGDEKEPISTVELNLLDERQAKVGFERMVRAGAPFHHFNDFISGNADAETADVWFQFCVFGEIRYG